MSADRSGPEGPPVFRFRRKKGNPGGFPPEGHIFAFSGAHPLDNPQENG